jgi:acetyl-CoA synthetase
LGSAAQIKTWKKKRRVAVSEKLIHPVSEAIARNAHINKEQFKTLYRQSIDDPDSFWAEQAEKFLHWTKKWDKVQDWSFKDDLHIEWFSGARLNVSYNCLDRHLDSRGDQTAIIWEGDDPGDDKHITYRELHEQVCRFANVLKANGVKKGDRVCIYLPMIPEAAVAMLACARIGAIHSVVFGGFSPEALKDRILNSECKMVITADEGVRGGRSVPLKANADKAIKSCECVEKVIVVKRTGGKIDWQDSRDIWYHETVAEAAAECEPEQVDAEDPLFILYTSGSTGKPKGVLHTSGGYLLFAAMTHKFVFDYQEGEIYWCTADVGWVTGHSYIIYGPLANGAVTLMFEGVPTYPDAGRFWQVVDKHKVNIFYTAPTAIRALMGQGDDFVKKTDRKSLRILATVGEPINPEAWEWYIGWSVTAAVR